ADYFFRYNGNVHVQPMSSYIQSKDLTSEDILILGPGPGIPSDYPEMLNILNEPLPCPVIGICLGCQALAIHLGGTLFQSSPKFGVSENLYLNGKTTSYKYTRYHAWSVEFPSEKMTE